MSFLRRFKRKNREQPVNVVPVKILKNYDRPPAELEELLKLSPTTENCEKFEKAFISAATVLLLPIFAAHGRGAIILDLTRWPKILKSMPFWTVEELEQKLALYEPERELIKSYNRLTTGLVFALRPDGKRKLWEVEYVKR